MHESLQSIQQRRFRLAQTATVAGSLAVGALVVDRLVAVFRDDFFLFYGVSAIEQETLASTADAKVPLTLGQLVVAAIALFAVIGFVASERRRLRVECRLSEACSDHAHQLVVERLSFASMFDAFVLRTSSFAGVLLAVWLLQSSVARYLGGHGLGIEYADWRSLLPLASVFGVCVLAGMLVAGVSLFGLRAIHVLELALQRAGLRIRRARVVRRAAYWTADATRTLRELIGCDILSRPPPAAA